MNTIASTSAKNHYETLIDNLMLQEVAGHNPELYSILLNADPSKRRYGILSILDKDRNMFLSIKNIIKKNAVSKTEHIKDVVRMLRDYVKVGEVEKKKFGEVMTPISLVNEMLDTLPAEVWSNPDLKWLDPANGCGVFPSVVVERLMVGLESWQPNEELRYKHIMENMIYVCELQPKNMFLFLCAFDPNDEYELNVYTGSFLDSGFDEHMKNVWGVEKFDIVVGNVPYQEEISGSKRMRTLYHNFTYKSSSTADYVVFVTPSRWMGGGFSLDDFRKWMFNNRNLKLIIHFDDSQKVFGKNVDIMGGVSYFLIDNKEVYEKTLFNGSYTDFSDFDIHIDEYNKPLLKKILSYNRFLSDICKSKSYWMNFNDKELHESKDDTNILCYVSQQKGLVKYIPINCLNKDYSSYKVFTPSANGNNPKFGQKIIGLPNEVASNTYMTFLVKTHEEAESLVSYMNTKFCNFFLSLRKITQNMKPDTLKWIPLVPFDREWTDEQLFEYFSLTDEEISLILSS